jgi:hypothetical protein
MGNKTDENEAHEPALVARQHAGSAHDPEEEEDDEDGQAENAAFGADSQKFVMGGVGADEGGEMGGDGNDDFACPHAPAEKGRGRDRGLKIGPDEIAVGEAGGLAELGEVDHAQEGEAIEEQDAECRDGAAGG